MIYMTPHNSATSAAPSGYGSILTPASGFDAPLPGRPWCADNEAFTGRFEWSRFAGWLRRMELHKSTCVFVAVPDVVADAIATLEKFRWYAWQVKAMGWPVALVAQDGLESLRWPPSWVYDALFVGGTTEWKLSTAADWCIQRAQAAGKWIHVGRVNSLVRMRHFALVGVDSVDGTSLCFRPNQYHKLFARQLHQPILLRVK